MLNAADFLARCYSRSTITPLMWLLGRRLGGRSHIMRTAWPCFATRGEQSPFKSSLKPGTICEAKLVVTIRQIKWEHRHHQTKTRTNIKRRKKKGRTHLSNRPQTNNPHLQPRRICTRDMIISPLPLSRAFLCSRSIPHCRQRQEHGHISCGFCNCVSSIAKPYTVFSYPGDRELIVTGRSRDDDL
jgi:hypothetical protein